MLDLIFTEILPKILDECLYELQMLKYDKIGISKRIDINKTISSCECIICVFIIPFGDTGFEKHEFSFHKTHILTDDIKMNKVIVSNNASFPKECFKYLIRYKDNERVQPLCIMFPKMSGYAKSFNETKYMSFWKKMNYSKKKK